MQSWIELLAHALDRSNTFPLEQVLEPAVNGLETFSERRRRFLDMLKRKLKAVGQLEQREDDRALSSLSRLCPLILYALAIILEIRQGTQIHLVLLTQLLLEPFDFRAFRIRRSNVMGCFHNRGHLVSLNSASMTSSVLVGRPPAVPPAPAPAAVAWP